MGTPPFALSANRSKGIAPKLTLDLYALRVHMQGADVMQLDHCFPFRLQSFDFDTD